MEETDETQLESSFDAQRMRGFGCAERLRKEGIEHLAKLEIVYCENQNLLSLLSSLVLSIVLINSVQMKNKAALNELASKIRMKPGHRLKFVLAILRSRK
mmetsp:Transcript_6130/g.10176  ORF Transcript_6130/g.10176 Transcript_6130/m.10176 type:complete len:100 (-) Transcript_6130:31-330(-)